MCARVHKHDISFAEGETYKLTLKGGTIIIVECDEGEVYILKTIGATKSTLSDGRTKIKVLFSFEESA